MAPPVSIPSRVSESTFNNKTGGSNLTRAAASSSASGKPSTLAQICAIQDAFAEVKAKSEMIACARSTKSWIAPYCESFSVSISIPTSGTSRGGTRNSYSPYKCNTTRLVTSTLSPGAAANISSTTILASPTCSKLSSTSISCFFRR